MNTRAPLAPRRRSAKRQRGVVLLFSLIALVIMLIVAVALVRSFNNSLFTAGNIGFKRDLQNQSERAVDKALTEFRTGALSSSLARGANVAGSNYSATLLPTNAEGIPDALQSDSTFSSAGFTGPDISPPNMNVNIRYVIDRLCASTGDETTSNPATGVAVSATCRLGGPPPVTGGGLDNIKSALSASLCPTCTSATPQSVLYRLSIKVTGPRNTQSFFQSTFTVPSS